MSYSTTIAGNTYSGIYLPVTADDQKPAKAPKGLIATRAVETKAGWVGQILIDQEIVFETSAKEGSDDALEEVNKRVVARVKKLFV